MTPPASALKRVGGPSKGKRIKNTSALKKVGVAGESVRIKKVKKVGRVKAGREEGKGKKAVESAKQRQLREEQVRLDRERQENIDKVSCSRCMPFEKASERKKKLYNSKYHVSKTTIAKRLRSDFKQGVAGGINLNLFGNDSGGSGGRGGGRRTKQSKCLVKIGKSPVHAWGLFASEFIKKGTRVIEYIGVVSRLSVGNVKESLYQSQGLDSSYLFRVGRDVIDATFAGGPARYINHSCDPNCKPKSFTSDSRIWIFSIKDIQPGEELCYDYKFDYEEGDKKIPCCCGAKNCSGYMN
uniref:[histone H3]-lysine(4) N-trimethyltransferase n=1 Tax=Chloropicon laureae TaxID=464258 RepID=A0A7S2Z8K1_9CHLO